MNPSPSPVFRIAIVGSGPAALMAASQLLLNTPKGSVDVRLYEKRAGFGRKLLIAGSSGLNISNSLPVPEFARHYSGGPKGFWEKLLPSFSPSDWIAFLEKELGQETFLGTSDRYFVREMKASGLLRAWLGWLESREVRITPKRTLSDFSSGSGEVRLNFAETEDEERCDYAVFALGGGSWEESEPEWCSLFRDRGLEMKPFLPSNVGYEVEWPEGLLKEAEGKPLKKVRLTTARGSKLGEMVITRYGLEGTPVYFVGTEGDASLDLKPDLTHAEVLDRLRSVRENLSPIRRVKQRLNLAEASQALLFHLTTADDRSSLETLVDRIKALPLRIIRPRPLSEAISSLGGITFSEVTPNLELRGYPGIHVCGEMLDWDAPTGGFLIQGAVAQGALVGRGLASRIRLASNRGK